MTVTVTVTVAVELSAYSDVAKEQIRRKTVGWGSLGALERARRARADTWEVRRVEEDGGWDDGPS